MKASDWSEWLGPVTEHEGGQGRAPGLDLLEAGVGHDVPGVLHHDHRHLDQ